MTIDLFTSSYPIYAVDEEDIEEDEYDAPEGEENAEDFKQQYL